MVSRSTAVAATARSGLSRIQARGGAHEQQPHHAGTELVAQGRGRAHELLTGERLLHEAPENVQSSDEGLVVVALCAPKVRACSMQGTARSPPQGCRTAGKRRLIALLKLRTDGYVVVFC